MDEKQNDASFSLTLTFRDNSEDKGVPLHAIPDDKLEQLRKAAEDTIIAFFDKLEGEKHQQRVREAERNLKKAKAEGKTGDDLNITATPRLHAIDGAKLAFDRHRANAQPFDDAELAISEAKMAMSRLADSNTFPSAINNLHPVVKFVPRQ